MPAVTLPSSPFRIALLGESDVPALAALEEAAWPSGLRAREATIRARLALGHMMLGARGSSGLVAAACFTPTAADPHDRAAFPRDFASFSSLPRSAPVRSLYVYNLEVHPAQRGTPLVHRVIESVIAAGRQLGARWLVGDGRCPAYAGAQGEGADKVRADPVFRDAIEQWRASGNKPPDPVLTRDPLLRFYRRVLACRFLHLMPDFLPSDTGSGGYRVIFVQDLQSGFS